MDGLSPKILSDQNLQIRFLGRDLMLHLFLDPPFFWISNFAGSQPAALRPSRSLNPTSHQSPGRIKEDIH